MIAEVSGERPSGSDDSLRLTEDLHLDSLGRVQLQSSLEQQLGLEFADDALSNLETLGQLRALIAEETGAQSTPTTAAPQSAAQPTSEPAPSSPAPEAAGGTPF